MDIHEITLVDHFRTFKFLYLFLCSHVSYKFRFQIPADALKFPHQSVALHLKVT